MARALAAEALLFVAITVAVALLGSTTPPSAIAETQTQGPTVIVGRQADDLAVGISATPSADDQAAVDVSVLDPSAAPARNLTVAVARAGGTSKWTTAAPCGAGHWCATLSRTAQLVVRLTRPGGRTSTVTAAIPADPQPARAARSSPPTTRKFRALRTLVIQEHLSPGIGEALDTTFRIQAPDRVSYSSRRAGQAIIIGNRRWDRAGPGHRWVPATQERLHVPGLEWGSVQNPSLLGSGTVAWPPGLAGQLRRPERARLVRGRHRQAHRVAAGGPHDRRLALHGPAVRALQRATVHHSTGSIARYFLADL